jgi:hypothetical protein
MNTPPNPEQSSGADRYWEALLYAVAGGIVLVGTWYFFGRHLLASDTEWYAWIRPMLLALGGVLCLFAAVLTAARHPSGRDLLQLAVGIIPLVFAIGLLILPLRFIGGVMDWIGGNAALPSFDGVIDRLWSSQQRLALNLAVIAAVILLGILGHSAKSRAEQEEQRSKQ